MTLPTTLGLDVGGAHLKAACLDSAGRLTETKQIVCPLWRGFDQLDQALSAIADWTGHADGIAVTMTGELSDIFKDRAEGVHRIVDRLERDFAGRTIYWCAPGSFVTAEEVRAEPARVASMNFLATAQFGAAACHDGLVIDLGTTTCDIIPFRNGRVCATGLSDADRLLSGELVYTGLTRTAVMSVVDRAPLNGVLVPVCRELFANMADVRRVLDALPAGSDLHDTCDGAGKSREESQARLARMFGRDAGEASDAAWRTLAHYIATRQCETMGEGLAQVLSRHPELSGCPAVVAGCGFETAARVAKTYNLDPIVFDQLVPQTPGRHEGLDRNVTAPAIAVALLAARRADTARR